MKLNDILPVVIGALAAIVIYDMFVKDLIQSDGFDSRMQ